MFILHQAMLWLLTTSCQQFHLHCPGHLICDVNMPFIIENQRAETDWLLGDNLYSPFTVDLDSAMDLVTLVLVLVELVVGENHTEVKHQDQDDGGGEAESGHHQPLLELHDYSDSELPVERAHWTSVDKSAVTFPTSPFVTLLYIHSCNCKLDIFTRIAFAL